MWPPQEHRFIHWRKCG